jgi:hypothetical protein
MENTAIIRKVQRKAKPDARCRGGSAQRPAKRTPRNDGNGFLNHRFLPFWAYSGNGKRAEEDFFRSLVHLCAHYGLPLPEVQALVFPQNVFISWQEVRQQIRLLDKGLDCIILKDETHGATLATVRRLDTGTTLYYIPVRPLYRWVKSCREQEIAELMLAVFAYLYQVVKIPFYADRYSYMEQQYDCLYQWVMEEEDEEAEAVAYRDYQLGELDILRRAGDELYIEVSNPNRLEQFEPALERYRVAPESNWEMEALAGDFLALYKALPTRTYLDNIHPELDRPEEEERISAEQYVSFYWSGRDCFADSLEEMINCNFQEISVMDEPISVTLFDTLPTEPTENLEFETRLFALLDRLKDLLYDYDHEQCEP